MALAAITQATKPIQTKGLFAASGGDTFEKWKAGDGGNSPFPSIAPTQVDDTVTTPLNKLLKSDSPLMQVARTEGLKVANRRGLLNSSLAAGASQKAMIEAALPIASQEASQAYGKNQAARAFEFSMASQDDAQDFTAEQAGLDRSFSREQAGLDRALQEKLASWNLASSDRNAAAQFLTNMENLYQSSYQSIMANTDLSAEQRTQQVAAARALRDRQLNFVEQMYDVDLDWGDPITAIPVASSPAPVQQQQGGKVLCTYFHNKGLLDPAIYAADLAYAAEHVSETTKAGYHAWAVPLVAMIETGKHPLIERVALFFVRRWAGEMAWIMGVTEKSTLIGRAMRVIGEPACGMIGRLTTKGPVAAL